MCTAPFVFTKLTKPVVAFLRSMGICIVFYLDDILIIGSSEECGWNVDIALWVLRKAGFFINLKKSSLILSQRFQYLGLVWDTTKGQWFEDLSSMA